MSLVQWLNLPTIGDERGSLVILEGSSTIPFEIRRVYYLFGTKPEVARGFHAHKELQQIAICVAGRCRMTLDNGKTQEEAWLTSPNEGLIIDRLIWHEMHDFSEDCILLVLASDHYDEADYIRRYKDFIEVAAT